MLANDGSSPPSDKEADITEVASNGDLILHIEHTGSNDITHRHSLRVRTKTLVARSKFFERLVNGRFGEDLQIAKKHAELREQYSDFSLVPPNELPSIDIVDLGRISIAKSIAPLLDDFFGILHGGDIAAVPLVGNLANLALVADRFDALEAVGSHLRRKKTFKAIDAKLLAKQDLTMTEERVRQRILVGLLLDHSLWLEKYSVRLVVKGWVGHDVEVSEALWWDLPSRVEDEIAFRRACILETIQALQNHFLGLYSSRARMCRLGYDSSPECDSFQFGEMTRFFLRSGTLKLQSSIADSDDPIPPYDGDLTLLIEKLKQIPEYQVNSHHSHCGIRTQLVPKLDLIATAIQHAGICGECWNEDRHGNAWIEAKRPLVWRGTYSNLSLRLKQDGHGRRHTGVRDLFMATQRDWT